MNRLGNILAFS